VEIRKPQNLLEFVGDMTFNTSNWEEKLEVKRSMVKVIGNENVNIVFRAYVA